MVFLESEYVCDCCALVIANGDNSACRDYYGHTHGDPAGLWALGDEWVEACWLAAPCAACGVEVDQCGPMLEAYRVCPLTDGEVESATSAYLATALWAEADDDGLPLEDTYGIDDFDAESVTVARANLIGFLMMAPDADIRAYLARGDAASLGMDLWLTAGRHGAGFWARDLGDAGDRLTEAAHSLERRAMADGESVRLY